MNQKIKVEKITSSATLPTYSYAGDAGMDLYADGDFVLQPGERLAVPTGVRMAIPTEFVGLVWDKSGVGIKGGMKTLGGVIDSGYRGEIKIGLVNLSAEDYKIKTGDKIAQMLIQPVSTVELEEGVVELTTDRGDRGFGSTGV